MRSRLLIFCIGLFFLSAAKPSPPIEEKSVAIQEALSTPYIYHSVNVINGEYCESEIDMRLEGPYPIDLRRCYFSSASSGQGWHFNHPSIIGDSTVLRQNSEKGPMRYRYDQQNRLNAVEMIDPVTQEVMRWFEFHYGEGQLQCQVQADDGRALCYTFKEAEPNRLNEQHLLESVTVGDLLMCCYRYSDHPFQRKKMISRRDEPNNRYLINEYYDDKYNHVGKETVYISDPIRDSRIGRVKIQKAPLGDDEKPQISARFFYFPGYTEVYNALDHKTTYHYSKEGRLTAIENYLKGPEGSHQLYRVERFFWNKQQLLSRTVEDACGQVHKCQTFEYDKHGNVKCDALFGNLSGANSKPIILEKTGLPEKNGVECYHTYYQYDEKRPHLLLAQLADNGHKILYRYPGESDQLSAKFFCDGEKIRIRHFYTYDSSGAPASVIVDDGCSEDVCQLIGVTERHETHMNSRTKRPAIGLPETLEEYYIDLATGQKRLLKRLFHQYAESGKLKQQDVYDSAGTYRYSMTYQYDDIGRPVDLRQGDDHFQTMNYDLNGNVIAESNEKGQFIYQYDYANRLISKSEHLTNGILHHDRFRYDFNGNRVAARDLFENETTCRYDALNRLTEICHPPVLNEKGILIHPTERREYDLFDRVAVATDPNGYTFHTDYNLYGKPVRISYPDGSEERFIYNLDGTLKNAINKQGLTTTYQYDFQGRLTEECTHTPSGKTVQARKIQYTAFHKVAESTLNGPSVSYSYDHAGRQVAETQHLEEGEICTEYFYDEAGNLITKKERYGSSPDEMRVTRLCYDGQNQLTELQLQNSQEQLLRRVSSKADEEECAVTYQYDSINALGQNVLQKTVTSCDGNLMVYLYDAVGRTDKITVKNPMGEVLSERQCIYDASGNLSVERHGIYLQGKLIGTSSIGREYDGCRRLVSITEAYGTDLQRTTRYRYALSGELLQQIKPDGVMLDYLYDECGKLMRMQSSDGTIDYRYCYDMYGNAVLIEDGVTLTKTSRTYNAYKAIVSEQLANNLYIQNSYDLLGRRTTFVLPDRSSAAYTYDSVSLKMIERFSADKKLQYAHRYTVYSEEGDLQEAKLIGKAGVLSIQRDGKRQVTALVSPAWSQKIEKGYDAIGRVKNYRVTDVAGTYLTAFEYDENGQISEEVGDFRGVYSHDSLYNRHTYNDQKYRHDILHQLQQAGTNSYRYDLNGNLIESAAARSVTKYRYDALDRLVEVMRLGQTKATYTYDCFNRRISKQTYTWMNQQWQCQSKQRFLYDGDNEIGTVDEQDCLTQLRILGTGLGAEHGAAVAVELNGSVYAPVHDFRGSVCALVDLKGSILEAYRYSAFGEEKIFNGRGERLERAANPWRYASKRYDEESGLLFFGRRYYAPEIGRFVTKDPLGFSDCPNRYCYTLNNPLKYLDLYGHFSFSSLFKDFYKALQTAYDLTSSLKNSLQGYFSCSQQAHNFVKTVTPYCLDPPLLNLAGFYSTQSECGVYGHGEGNDKVRITMINGILNARADYRYTLECLSKFHGDNNVHYVYDASQGWTDDIRKAALAKMGYLTPEARMLAALWKGLIKEMGGTEGGGLIIHYAHSLGGALTNNAKELLTPEEQKMIRVITLATATVMEPDGFESVTNYVSVRDMVYLIDPFAYINCLFYGNDAISFVGSWFGVPFGDHTLNADTYAVLLRKLGIAFQETYL